MTIRKRIAGAVLATAALIAPILALGPAAAAAPRSSRATDEVLMTVVGTAPYVPIASLTPMPLTFEIQVTNTTGQKLPVRITGERGDPISTQADLDKAIANPTPPASGGEQLETAKPVEVELAPGQTRTVTYSTTSGIDPATAELCICWQAGVYPLFFNAYDASDQVVGTAPTYIPTFFGEPPSRVTHITWQRAQVSWVWPLIDRPHRLASSSVFTDDTLATEVAPGGRLWNALQVVTDVGGGVPMTLVIDPELLDELEVMATGTYRVVTSRGHTAAGTGGPVAAAWLARLHTVLIGDPGVHVVLTPYADPDVQTLSANNLTWSTTLPLSMQAHVLAALSGRPPDSSIAWPASGAIGARTLANLYAGGVRTVVLNAAAVKTRTASTAVPSAVAQLRTGGHDVSAALLSPTLQKYATAALTGGPGQAAIAPLVAQIAIRVAEQADTAHSVVLAAPRYVNPDVAAADATIRATSSSPISTPVGLASLVKPSAVPTRAATLAPVPASAEKMPPGSVALMSQLEKSDLPTVESLLDPTDPNAQTLIISLRTGLQRGQSSAWRNGTNPHIGASYLATLESRAATIQRGVHLVVPSSGSYTLASSNSPLPITIQNDLRYAVFIRVTARAENGLPGFRATPTPTERIDANSKRILHLATNVDRTGRLQVTVDLEAPNHAVLGSIPLTIHSTALGIIGIIITIAAGVVLVAALIVRFTLRLRARRRKRRGDTGPVGRRREPREPSPSGTAAVPATPAAVPATPTPATRAEQPEPMS